MAQLRAAQLARKKAIPQKRAAEDDERESGENNVVKGSHFEAEVDKMIRAEGGNVPGDEAPSTTPATPDETPGKNGKGKSKKKKSKGERKRQRLEKQERQALNQRKGSGN